MKEKKRKRIIITGATGFIGKQLYNKLRNDYEIIVFTRNIKKAKKILGDNVNTVYWNGGSMEHIIEYLEGTYGIINLAGENIGNRKWTKKQKQNIFISRIRIVNLLNRAISRINKKPKVIIQASAIGYYGFNDDKWYDETVSINAKGFLAEVTRNWEKTINTINPNIRCIIIRLGVVLGKDGGLLKKIMPLFRFYLGGYPEKGKQWISWIHIEDVANAISFLLKNKRAVGIYNLTAPNPTQFKYLVKNIGKLIKRPSWLSIPGIILILLFRQRAKELLLGSLRVYPKRLIAEKFKFSYNNIEEALYNIF